MLDTTELDAHINRETEAAWQKIMAGPSLMERLVQKMQRARAEKIERQFHQMQGAGFSLDQLYVVGYRENPMNDHVEVIPPEGLPIPVYPPED